MWVPFVFFAVSARKYLFSDISRDTAETRDKSHNSEAENIVNRIHQCNNCKLHCITGSKSKGTSVNKQFLKNIMHQVQIAHVFVTLKKHGLLYPRPPNYGWSVR